MANIGPFSFQVVLVAAALLLAWLLARFVPRRRDAAARRKTASLLLDAFMVGLVAARLAYVARWWPDYLAQPRSMLAIADGGFYWWAGVVAAAAFVAWRTRRLPQLRVPVAAAGVAGLAAWALALGAVALMHTTRTLPQLVVRTLDDRPVQLTAYAGRPLVVNLWATWCPPCQREMPALARAEQAHPDVTFLMVNQGEGAPTIQRFLQRMGLRFDHVLLDYGSTVLKEAGAGALPTTLFFDAQGRMVSLHTGEITAARLRDQIGQLMVARPDGAPAGR
ncbi:MAG: TlpA disulfide reductase family protein [Ottowia sp.]